MSEKNAAFHRLAQKRMEALIDQVRVFSNLSGPSYDWSQEEVWAYFTQITQALEQALARFQEQKRWSGAGNEAQAPAEAEDPESPAEPEAEEPPISKSHRRAGSIKELIRAAENDTEMLPEMLVMQREVIADLQSQIDRMKTKTFS